MLGERSSKLVSFEMQKLLAAAVLVSPCLPMLFMGEEYIETAPFHYFVSFEDQDLIEAVRRGRAEEFGHFGDFNERLYYGYSIAFCLPDGMSHQPSAGTGTVTCLEAGGRDEWRHSALEAQSSQPPFGRRKMRRVRPPARRSPRRRR